MGRLLKRPLSGPSAPPEAAPAQAIPSAAPLPSAQAPGRWPYSCTPLLPLSPTSGDAKAACAIPPAHANLPSVLSPNLLSSSQRYPWSSFIFCTALFEWHVGSLLAHLAHHSCFAARRPRSWPLFLSNLCVPQLCSCPAHLLFVTMPSDDQVQLLIVCTQDIYALLLFCLFGPFSRPIDPYHLRSACQTSELLHDACGQYTVKC